MGNGVYLIRQNIPSELSWNEHCPGHLVLLELCVISNVKGTPQPPGPQVLWSQRVSETPWHSASTVCWSLRMRQCASRAGELSSLELGLGVERSWCWNYFGLGFFFLSFVPLIIIINGTERVKKNGDFILLWTQSFWPKLLPSLGHLLAASTRDAEAQWVNDWVTLTVWAMGANAGSCAQCSLLSPQSLFLITPLLLLNAHCSIFPGKGGKHPEALQCAVLCKGGVSEQGTWVPACGKLL